MLEVLLEVELESGQDVLVLMEHFKDNGRQSLVFQLPVLLPERIIVCTKLFNFPVAGFVDYVDGFIQMLSEYFLSS